MHAAYLAHHDNENGILSDANIDSDILIEYTEFGHNGYGANGTFSTRVLTGSVGCSNTVFGNPVHGVLKTCSYASALLVTAGTSAGSIACTTTAFGGDPAYRVVKSCSVANATK